MASISRDDNGRVTLQFVHPTDQKRRTVRPGKMSERDSVAFKLKVEALVASSASGLPLDQETQRWLARISDGVRDKLVAVGLVTKLASSRLGEFLDGYINGRTDVKPRTRINLLAARNRLVEHFKPDRSLREITPADADGFLRAMLERYAPATVGRTVRRAQQFFRHAVRGKLLLENPFTGIKAPQHTNRARIFFVTREMTDKVLEACGNPEWRLIFALCRVGGLRCPSEVLGLTWQDVDWAANKILIRSPKTEHHEGKDERWIPLFAELRPYLEVGFDQAAEGATFIITRYRSGDQNLRSQLSRIIRRAGLSPWPRLFQNLRATRETELMAVYPVHVVTAWMGHEALIAAKHYLSVTDEDFTRAAAEGAGPSKAALQNPVQQGTETGRTEPQVVGAGSEICGYFREDASGCNSLPDKGLPRVGRDNALPGPSFSVAAVSSSSWPLANGFVAIATERGVDESPDERSTPLHSRPGAARPGLGVFPFACASASRAAMAQGNHG
jgi:integrase